MSKKKSRKRIPQKNSQYICSKNNNRNIKKITKNTPAYMMTKKVRLLSLKRQRFAKNKKKR